MNRINQAAGNRILGLIDNDDRHLLVRNSVTRKYQKGDQIVRYLDNDTNLYLINEGRVRVTLYSSEGKEVSFVDIETGGNFGEISAIDGKPRSANVIALTKVEITIVPPQEFNRILRKYPDVSIEILGQLTRIVRRLCDRIYEYSTMDVGKRILIELGRIASQNIDLDGVARIRNPPTQAEIASRVSCVREAVSREFNMLEAEGIITRKPKLLMVNDYQRLQELIYPVTRI